VLTISLPSALKFLLEQSTSVVLGALLSAGIAYTRWVTTRRLPARRMWRYAPGGDITVVAASTAVIDTGKYSRPTTGVGQIRALALLAPCLVRAYRQVDLEQIRLASEAPGRELEHDLLVLGGAKNNRVTRQLLERIPGLPFSAAGDVIAWEGVDFEGTTDGRGVTHDYGYVVRARNPFAADRRVVLIAGSHTYGTVAAARWFVEHGSERDLPADVAVLVEADVHEDGHVTVPRDVRMKELPVSAQPE
jgi:hypothetical protein